MLRPPRKSAIRMPIVVSMWKLWVMPMWPESWAVKTSWCQKMPRNAPARAYWEKCRHVANEAKRREYRRHSQA